MPDAEINLNRFLNSSWFRHLARTSMIVGTFIAGYAGVKVGEINSRIENLEQTDVAAKQATAVRVADQEAFQLRTDEDLASLQTSLEEVHEDITAIKEDAATVRGILQEMQRRDKALMRPSIIRN